MTRITLVIGLVLLLVAAGFLVIFGGAFMQDEPHPAVLSAIARLYLSGEDIIPVNSTTLVAKTSHGTTPIIHYFAQQGWQYREQMGAGLIFEKDRQRLTIVTRLYSRYYQLIDISSLQ
jgi:hypothetical protein